MSVSVAVYKLRGNSRSERIAAALAEGIRAAGDRPIIRGDGEYGAQREPVAAFYGFKENLPRVMADYRASGRTAVFIDLGYWGRREGGRFEGYHKVAVNDRHPTDYFQNRPRDASRVRRFRLKLHPWRENGRYVLVAGMSGKSAESYGMKPTEWEEWAIEEVRRHTDREVLYRPKPSWFGARELRGAKWCPPGSSLDAVLRECHAVVTHHSNVAIDALISGVPAFCWDGVAKPMSLQDLSLIETPLYPEGRGQWAADIAWCQWSVPEMRSGAMWRHLKDEGLVRL